MRRACLLVLLVLVGCKETADTSSASGRASSSEAAASEVWTRIADLAQVEPTIDDPQATRSLHRAFAISSEHLERWNAASLEDSDAEIESFPGAQSAFAALQEWSEAGGGLLPDGPESGRHAIVQARWVELAANAATEENHAALLAIERLGRLQVTRGRNLLEATLGAHALEASRRRLKELGIERDATPVGPEQLARILAAEALYAKRKLDELRNDEGAKEQAQQAIDGLDPETKAAAIEHGLELGVPDDARIAAEEVFWVEALDGATRGEPAETTLARLRRAADRCSPSCQRIARDTVFVAEHLIDQLGSVSEAN